jgi:predicted enzyme related to lactoylglutathione lyase
MVRLAWFEIPVNDLERAVSFYNSVFATEVAILDKRANYGSMVGLLIQSDALIGTLTQNIPYVPSRREGCILYLNVDDEPLQTVLLRVEAAGGQVLLPVTPIDPHRPLGHVAWILDSEGNRIGLHSGQ